MYRKHTMRCTAFLLLRLDQSLAECRSVNQMYHQAVDDNAGLRTQLAHVTEDLLRQRLLTETETTETETTETEEAEDDPEWPSLLQAMAMQRAA
jgi:hypothetical protein